MYYDDPMDPNDTTRILSYYKDALTMFGDHDARSVHWSDEYGQNARFLALSQIANITHSSILDVGCGLGDLYTFLQKNNITVDYTGIDIVPDFIVRARELHPGVRFEARDIFTMKESFDYVLASGALSFKVKDHKKYYFSMIEKMFSLATKGLAFNMLNHDMHVDDDTYASYKPEQVADFCKTLTPNVQIILGYLPQDFTIYMLK
jgi:trans-aconitate methyltransferase